MNTSIYLYVKRHAVTGMLYFGKTRKSLRQLEKYNGSGKYWLKHLRKHGTDIETLVVFEFDDADEAEMFALKFSRENDVVASPLWANLKPENARDGSVLGMKFENRAPPKPFTRRSPTPETRRKISASLSGRRGKLLDDETKKRIAERMKGNINGKAISEEGRKRLSEANRKQKSEETKKKMSEARKHFYKSNPKPPCFWITNLDRTIEKQTASIDSIPDGWIRGRKTR